MRTLPCLPAALLAVLACAHQQAAPEAEPVAAAQPAPAAPEPAAPAPPAATSCGDDTQCGSTQLCVDARCVDVRPGLQACRDVTVHFGFDEAALAPADLAALQRAARCVAHGAEDPALIDGHADERGTTEYNLVLGERRASAVKRYLESLGIGAARLRTVSYGKERPLCTEHDEACWAKNRRASIQADPDAAARR